MSFVQGRTPLMEVARYWWLYVIAVFLGWFLFVMGIAHVVQAFARMGTPCWWGQSVGNLNTCPTRLGSGRRPVGVGH